MQDTTSTTPPPQSRLRRFIRQPEKLADRQVTPKALEALALVERYRFLPTSLLIRLMPGNQRNTHRHLQTLFHKGLVQRFALPRYGGPSEFIYYVDSPHTLPTLIGAGLLPELTDEQRRQKETIIRLNRDNDYSQLHRNINSQGKVLYVHHELMISRLHTLLELGARKMGNVRLEQWKQGTELWGKVSAPAIRGGEEIAMSESLPWRPDAYFQLRFLDRPPEQQLVSWLYEADRGTENTTRFKMKLRAHYHAIVRQQLQRKDPYNVHSIRAVLTETTSTQWAYNLINAAKHPIVSPKPSPLFWFTTSEPLLKPSDQPNGRPLPRYLVEPELIFKQLWATPLSSKLKAFSDLD